MKIAVHDGTFHADEIFALAIIRLIFQDIDIIRTRDEELLNECDMRIDVGGRNCPETGDFDHHLTEGAGERRNEIPYAACGLVWKHFGKEVAGSNYVFDYVDRKLIQFIDANDNGFDIGQDSLDIALYDVSDIIDSFNTVWYEENDPDDKNFYNALEIADKVIKNEIKKGKGFEKAYSFVSDALLHTTNPHYVVLDKYCPWQDVVIPQTEILFVIFPSSTGEWRLRTVPVSRGSFKVRKYLPISWSGKKNDELAAITGVEDATFCHPACFIAGASSKEGAIKLAEIALDS